jgi:DNA-binding NarL/FixJ family response regulator
VAATAPEPLVAIVGGSEALAGEALACLIDASGVRVLGCYGGAAELEAALAESAATLDAAIVDADDAASGLGAVRALRRANAGSRILLLCEVASQRVLRCAIDEHVEGVVLKSDDGEELIAALRHVLAGRSVMPAGWQAASPGPSMDAQVGALSMREREVLELAASGMSNKEIAARLVVSCNTVKFHLRTIYSKLGVNNRVQAAQKLAQLRGV